MRSRRTHIAVAFVGFICASSPPAMAGDATEFCLDGQFDLGARLQGMNPSPGEFSPSTWCVITEDDTDRVHFRISGRSNPDMSGAFAVSYLPPDVVRIVNRDAPPDIEFQNASIEAEASRYRRIDPYRLIEELRAHPQWVTDTKDDWQVVRYPGNPAEAELRITDGKLRAVYTWTELPLKGRVPVRWTWTWPDAGEPSLVVEVDGDPVFEAQSMRRTLDDREVATLWQATPGAPPRVIPGSAWPAQIDMQLEAIGEDIYIVRGVRTGFHHLVIDTTDGLIVADAPTGWVELPQLPPADLVPGLGISGLSEQFVDFIQDELPGRQFRAVALSHAHDDHAGGARAFAAAGAEVYAPAEVSEFLETAMNRTEMPADRLSESGNALTVLPVTDRTRLDDANNRVEFVNMGPGPHVSASMGVWAVDAGYFFQSDLHVPRSDAETPRAERAQTECWFARWATQNLPEETVVLSSHTLVRTPVSRLAKYLDSDLCQ